MHALFGHQIQHHPVATIPLRGGTRPAQTHTQSQSHTQAQNSAAPVVVGVCGTDESYWAVEYSARAVRAEVPLYLVSAVARQRANPHRSREERRWRDELGVDAYQLEELSVIHEVQRRAREVACAAGASDVRALVRSGEPQVVLARESRDLDAAAMVLGYASGPGRLARRLCATTDVPLLVVNRGVDAGYLLTASPRGVRTLRERRRTGAPATAE